jgi:hypothetical protein
VSPSKSNSRCGRWGVARFWYEGWPQCADKGSTDACASAVGFDTYEGEPKLNLGYLSLQNTFLLPHIGAATIETRTAMGLLALDNIDAVPGGRPAPSLVT